MSWGRMDDGFDDHPKVVAMLDRDDPVVAGFAIGLWTLAWTWAHRNTRKRGKTPGLLPPGLPRRWFGPAAREGVNLLVAHGLWDEHESGGWMIHDFADYLPTEGTREARSEAGKRGAAARWGKRDGAGDAGFDPDQDGNLPSDCHDEDGNGLASDGSRAPARRDPIPTPTPKDPEHPSDVLFEEPSKPTPPKPGSDDDPDWLRFWAAYPKKTSKKVARQRWAAAMKQKHDPEEIIRGAQQYADRMKRDRTAYQYLKNPDGWLNGELWRDEAPPAHFQDLPYALPSGHTGMNGIAVRDVKPQPESAEARKARGWLTLPTGGVQ